MLLEPKATKQYLLTHVQSLRRRRQSKVLLLLFNVNHGLRIERRQLKRLSPASGRHNKLEYCKWSERIRAELRTE
jgi:hypothetical protein